MMPRQASGSRVGPVSKAKETWASLDATFMFRINRVF